MQTENLISEETHFIVMLCYIVFPSDLFFNNLIINMNRSTIMLRKKQVDIWQHYILQPDLSSSNGITKNKETDKSTNIQTSFSG